MNNISNVLPMITLEFDPAVANAAEPVEPSSDDFASMLASVWCTPMAPQQPIEFVAEPETPNSPVVFATEIQTDNPTSQIALMPTGDVTIPQPILTFEDTPVVLESPIAEPGVKKIALPDISLPPQKDEKTEEAKAVVDPAVFIPSAQQVKTQAGTPRVPATGFARLPIDGTVSDPFEAKVNIPTRRPPTFIDPATASSNNEVSTPQLPHAEVSVAVQTSTPAESSTAPAVPDQVAAEAIKREANLAASYLAQSTRDSRESTFEALKAQVSGSGPDSRSNDSDGETNNKGWTATMNLSPVSFASALKGHSVETIKEIATPQVANQLVDLAAATQPRQQRSVRLRLRPEELGQVDIQLSRDSAGKVSAQVVVEREAARTALSQSLPQLRETLERAGLHVDQLNVSTNAGSFAGNNRDNHQSANESRSSLLSETSTTTSETQSKERVRDHKLLSLKA